MPLLEFNEGKTLFHRMSPSQKVVWGVIILGWLFVVFNPLYVLVAGVTIFVIAKFGAGLSTIKLLKTTAIVGIGSIFIVVFQSLLYPGQTVIFRFGPIHPTWEGVKIGLAIGLRLLSVVATSVVIARTTDPRDIYLTMIKLGLPYRVAHMLFTALRFIPMMQYEATVILEAQRVRGIAKEKGGLKNFLERMRKFLIPLLAVGVRRADQAAIAAEVRCFGLYKERTHLRKMSFSKQGWALPIVFLAAFAAYVVLTGGNLYGIWDTNPLRPLNE